MFSIKFTNQEQLKFSKTNEILGEIILGEFKETFLASLNYWSIGEYQAQWTEGLIRLVNDEGRSCLITNMFDPNIANFINWWPIYREGRKLIFHNQIYFIKKKGFDPHNPYVNIEERRTISETGVPISEWEISIDDINEYLRNIK